MHPDSKLILGIGRDKAALCLRHHVEVGPQVFSSFQLPRVGFVILHFPWFFFRVQTDDLVRYPALSRSLEYVAVWSHAPIYITKPEQPRLLLSPLLNAISCTMAGIWDGLSASHPTKTPDLGVTFCRVQAAYSGCMDPLHRRVSSRPP